MTISGPVDLKGSLPEAADAGWRAQVYYRLVFQEGRMNQSLRLNAVVDWLLKSTFPDQNADRSSTVRVRR